MNNAFDYDKLIRLNLSKGINDVTTIGLLISAGLNPQSATQRLNAVKDSLNSKEVPLSLLPSSWVDWVKENLDRNCEPAELAQLLNKELNIPISKGHEIIDKILSGDFEDVVEVDAKFEYEEPIVQIKGNTIDINGHIVRLVMSHNNPPVMIFDNVLTADECDELIQLSKSKIKKSTVVDNETGAETFNKHRTSSGSSFKIAENDLIQKIEDRISILMNQPVENGEGIQVLNYQVGGEYRAHFDYFDPAHKGSKRHLAKGGQRVSTMVIYLNDVKSGGETTFPEIGLTVNPKKGSAVYFEYCNSKGQVDKKSLHAGCPVIEGEKWILTKWVRQNEFK